MSSREDWSSQHDAAPPGCCSCSCSIGRRPRALSRHRLVGEFHLVALGRPGEGVFDVGRSSTRPRRSTRSARGSRRSSRTRPASGLCFASRGRDSSRTARGTALTRGNHRPGRRWTILSGKVEKLVGRELPGLRDALDDNSVLGWLQFDQLYNDVKPRWKWSMSGDRHVSAPRRMTPLPSRRGSGVRVQTVDADCGGFGAHAPGVVADRLVRQRLVSFGGR